VRVLGQVAEVAGVIPALRVLSRDETGQRGVAGRDGLTAHLDDADSPRWQFVVVLVDNRAGRPAQGRVSRSANVARRRGHGATQDRERIGVLVVKQARAAHENDTATVVSAMP
jgi:hypothetical protein